MKNFAQYLIESESKNTHLEHIEDEIFNGGIAGTRRAISFLIGIRNMLAGSSSSSLNITVKWDGSPSIVCGIDPENGKFFVATKSAFNKTPKLNYSHSDVEKNHTGPLVDILKICLDNLSQLNIKKIIQGDLLFLKDDIKTIRYGDTDLIAFRRNTITYGIPKDSVLAHQIVQANLGIVFHTSYSGKKIQDLKASFGANITGLNKTSKVWATNADIKDLSGTVTLTKQEMSHISSLLSELGTTFKKLDSQIVDLLLSNSELKLLIKTYINSKVKSGEPVSAKEKYAKGLVDFIKQKYILEIEKLKTDKGKLARQEKLNQLLQFIEKNQTQLMLMFMISALLSEAKIVLLKKLQKISSIGTFLETPDGFRVTSPEGFVISDKIGNAVKLVDRLEFSKANFTLNKGW